MGNMNLLKTLAACFITLGFVGLLNVRVSHAVEPACPSGYSYNQTSNKCEAAPLCPYGEYDPARDKCSATVDFICPAPYVYNSSTYRCEADPFCLCGVLTITTHSYCRDDSPCACSGYGGRAVGMGGCCKAADCPDGRVTNGTLCDTSVTISCPAGYRGLVNRCAKSI